MANYIKFEDAIAFHPGYYIEELIEESGLTQEAFAKRLNISFKNLNLLIQGKKNLSLEDAIKLSQGSGTSISYWINLQIAFERMMTGAIPSS